MIAWPGQGFPWDENTYFSAAIGGKMEMIQWLHMNGCPLWLHPTIINETARCGQLEVLKWLRSKGCHWNNETYDAA